MSNDPDYTDSLWSHAQHLLDATVGVYQQYDVALPDRRYVHIGTPAHDCEQVTVAFEQMYVGGPGDQALLPQKCDAPWTSVFVVQVVRKLPVSTGRGLPPSADDLNDSTRQKLEDAYLLMTMGTKIADEWGLGFLADVSPTEPQGGYQGMSLNIITAVP